VEGAGTTGGPKGAVGGAIGAATGGKGPTGGAGPTGTGGSTGPTGGSAGGAFTGCVATGSRRNQTTVVQNKLKKETSFMLFAFLLFLASMSDLKVGSLQSLRRNNNNETTWRPSIGLLDFPTTCSHPAFPN
jgi:hypothetical protein